MTKWFLHTRISVTTSMLLVALANATTGLILCRWVSPAWASDLPTEKFCHWSDLHSNERLEKTDGVHYFEFKTENGSDAFLLVGEIKSRDWHIKPIVNNPTATTSATTRVNDALASVNGAFFNLSNGESTSYITVSGTRVCDPTKNKALTGNSKLQPFLERIFNRTELRILKTKTGKLDYVIVAHNTPKANEVEIVHSIQAGPRLLPKLTAKEEAFVRVESDGKNVDSIGVEKAAARTAFGITKGGREVMILCVAGKRQNEYSSGLTLRALADLMKRLGCVEAINLDGGTSTTMAIRCADQSVQMTCGRDPETLVKSTLSLFRD